MNSVEYVARAFHDAYEEQARRMGWQSQTPVSWEELPDANRRTMVATIVQLMLDGVITTPARRTDAHGRHEACR